MVLPSRSRQTAFYSLPSAIASVLCITRPLLRGVYSGIAAAVTLPAPLGEDADDSQEQPARHRPRRRPLLVVEGRERRVEQQGGLLLTAIPAGRDGAEGGGRRSGVAGFLLPPAAQASASEGEGGSCQESVDAQLHYTARPARLRGVRGIHLTYTYCFIDAMHPTKVSTQSRSPKRRTSNWKPGASDATIRW